MVEQGSFVTVMAGIHTGDPDAAAEVFRRFHGRLIGLAHVHLAAWIRRKVDPEDVVQSVFMSFFLSDRGRWFEFRTWTDLGRLLAEITVRQCAGRMAYFAAQRRDASREVSPRPRSDGRDLLNYALASGPTAHEAAIGVDTLEQLTRGLGADDRAIIELLLAGYTAQEVSDQVGCSERTVRRVREMVRKRLLRMQADSGQEA